MGEKKEFEDIKSEISFWKAEQIGDVLEGRYVDIFDGEYGLQPVILSVVDNKKYVTPTSKHLVSLLKEVNLNDYVRITYVDNKKTDKPQPMKLFTLQRLKE